MTYREKPASDSWYKITEIKLFFTILRLIRNHTKFHLIPNQLKIVYIRSWFRLWFNKNQLSLSHFSKFAYFWKKIANFWHNFDKNLRTFDVLIAKICVLVTKICVLSTRSANATHPARRKWPRNATVATGWPFYRRCFCHQNAPFCHLNFQPARLGKIPSVWEILTSRGIIGAQSRAPLKPFEHYSTMLLKGLREWLQLGAERHLSDGWML